MSFWSLCCSIITHAIWRRCITNISSINLFGNDELKPSTGYQLKTAESEGLLVWWIIRYSRKGVHPTVTDVWEEVREGSRENWSYVSDVVTEKISFRREDSPCFSIIFLTFIGSISVVIWVKNNLKSPEVRVSPGFVIILQRIGRQKVSYFTKLSWINYPWMNHIIWLRTVRTWFSDDTLKFGDDEASEPQCF